MEINPASDEPPEDASAEARNIHTADLDGVILVQESAIPAIVGSPEVFIMDDEVDRNIGNEMENLQANMIIDLSRIQERMFSPIIILNNLNNEPELVGALEEPIAPDVPNAAADEQLAETDQVPVSPPSTEHSVRDSDPAEQPMGRPGRNAEESTPGSTPRRKKRKRTLTPKRISPPPLPKPDDDDDDGLICSICFAEWTMTGDHRVVSLKCGHLFGMSCIKRWLQDNPVATRCCATCKSRAKVADIRFIYGRAIKAIDNTREIELEQQLDKEKIKVNELSIKLSITSQELNEMRKQLDRIRTNMEKMKHTGLMLQDCSEPARQYKYSLTLEKNIVISNEPGCRAMVWANNHKMLLISQKSNQPLFPGYAIRLLQLPEVSGRSTGAVIHVGTKSVRDIALDVSDNLVTCATMEKTVKFYSLVTRTVQFSLLPDQDSVIWACAFDRCRPFIVYLGSQRGIVYVYDIRETNNFQYVFPVGHLGGDQTAIIKICPVDERASIPFGGFLVCKLKSVWFYEYTASEGVENAKAIALNIKGTFSSMSYNVQNELVLISVRPTPNVPSTLVLATLEKGSELFTLNILHRFEGSRVQTVMQRSAQVFLNNVDTLVAAYQEDTKTLSTWCTNGGTCWMQQLPLGETVLDICPLFGSSGRTYLAALSDCRCRIYNVLSK